MYVCTLLSFFLSLSLPLRFPLFLLFFSPFFFTSFIEPVIQTEWKVFKRGGPASPPCCVVRCAILHLSIMAMRCRFHSVGWKKAAQTAYRIPQHFLSSTILRNFISASAGYPCRCLNANARCQKAAGARSRRRSYLNWNPPPPRLLPWRI